MKKTKIMKLKPRTKRQRLDTALDLINDGIEIVKEVQEEMENWRDNMPENFQGGEKYEAIEQAADSLDNATTELETITGDLQYLEWPSSN